MRKGSSHDNTKLVEQLEHIKELIDQSIRLARSGKSVSPSRRDKTRQLSAARTAESIDFSVPIRPFIKKHAVGMGGAKKLTLLLAHLTGGDISKKVSLDEIQKQWSKMTAKGLLGVPFNRFYTSTAKDNDWVHTEKTGLYNLRPSWKKIFDEKR